MTYTTATLAVPPAVFKLLHDTMAELGQQRRFSSIRSPEGKAQDAIDFDGISILAGVDDDRDEFINSGRLSDLLVAVGEEAHNFGYQQGMLGATDPKVTSMEQGRQRSWDEYEPSDMLHEMQRDL